MAPQQPATMVQQQHQQQQQRRRRPRPLQTQRTPSHCSSCRTRGKPRNTFTVALTLLLAVCCCWCRHTVSAFPSSPGGSSSSPGLTLRVRMPDGAVKRVQATAGETVDDIMSKLGMGGGESGEGLSTAAAAGSDTAEGSASVAALGLRNGDFLYVKVRYVYACCRPGSVFSWKGEQKNTGDMWDGLVPVRSPGWHVYMAH